LRNLGADGFSGRNGSHETSVRASLSFSFFFQAG